MLSIELDQTPKQVVRMIEQMMMEEVNDILKRAAPGIKKDMQQLLRRSLRSTATYQDLFGGELQAEFGIANPEVKVNQVVDAWVGRLVVERRPLKKFVRWYKDGLTIKMVQADYQDVIGLDGAIQPTQRGEILPWLEWLLMRGGEMIIRNYEFSRGAFETSRTRLGIMVQSNESWQVPVQHQGTIDDNFVTRMLGSSEFQSELNDIVVQRIERA